MSESQKTTIDFPKELPLTTLFKITGVLNELEALHVISEIKKLQIEHFERFILDLTYTTKITGLGLGLIGFLIAQSKERVAIITGNEKHKKIFEAAGLSRRLLIEKEQVNLTAKLKKKVK